MGAMGAIASKAKNLWGDALKVAPTGFLLSFLSNSKISQLLQLAVWFITQPKCTVKITNMPLCK